MILTLCGSAKFEPWFHAWNKALTLSGHVVMSLGAFPSIEGEKNWYSDEQKLTLDMVHLSKIEESDGIVILNCFKYIGESTSREVEFAKVRDKRLYALEVTDLNWCSAFNLVATDSALDFIRHFEKDMSDYEFTKNA